MADSRPCKKCGMQIRFELAKGGSGKPIPLQKVRTVYVHEDGAQGEVRKLTVDPGMSLYVSHFETCPHAAEFSRKKAP